MKQDITQLLEQNTNEEAESKTLKVKYCLYARKSSESEERQVLSVDSQVKEMLELAAREELDVIEIRRESHSAKAQGGREVFNELLNDIRIGKFSGILTWAPDRLSRNAGDLGAIVDLMDQKKLVEIRTFGQRFTNSPSEKFLLMILGSQAKLENDNRGVNVKRGLRTRVEMGLWPGLAPLGYLNQYKMDQKCRIIIDPLRAPVIKQMFEKVAFEQKSGREVYNWLKHEINFYTRGNKPLTLAGVYRILCNSFYYGMFQHPKKSGKWYQGKHEPIINKDLFDKVQAQLKRNQIVRENREFSFTKLFMCGYCGSGISGTEKHKHLKDGTPVKYIYYGCTRAKDRFCKNTYVTEDILIEELTNIIDQVDINELGMRTRLEAEVKRFMSFQASVLGKKETITKPDDVNIRAYARYILQEGSITEKRQLLGNLKSRLMYRNKRITLVESSNTYTKT